MVVKHPFQMAELHGLLVNGGYCTNYLLSGMTKQEIAEDYYRDLL